MPKKVIVIEGSPRKDGNSAALAAAFEAGAEEKGALVETIFAASLNYKTYGCLACYACKKSDKFECVVRDEASEILASLPEYDVIVLVTPVYWFAASAQLKILFDRAYSLFKWAPTGPGVITPLKGKTLALLATGGGSMSLGLKNLDASYRSAARLLNMEYESLLVPSTASSPVSSMPELLEKAKTLGRKLTAE